MVEEQENMKRLLTTVVAICMTASLAVADERKPTKPTETDKCPVCGMFVAKYPDFMAEILFKDGSYTVFDGVKDMARYYLNFAKYNPSKTVSDIESIYVTDYYRLEFINGLNAFYIVDSNVFGPMGRELIPFEKEEDAREFMADHAGKSIVPWKAITQDLVKGLD
jgi:copper chaperone NosL